MSKSRGKFWRMVVLLYVLIVSVVCWIFVMFWTGRLHFGDFPLHGGPPNSARSDIANYETLLIMYAQYGGSPPSTQQGLKALIAKPAGAPVPTAWRQLLNTPILDSWEQEYFYENPGKHNPRGYDLFSAGPDRLPHTADDIGNWAQ